MRGNVDVWVRQVSGNTGAIGAHEAMRAAEQIQRNTASGLYPTTSGAVSLMAREDVDALHMANRGLFPKFRPKVPDANGAPAKSLGDWRIAAIEQALFHGSVPFDRHLSDAMDGFLHTYHGAKVDWQRVHRYAMTQDATVARMGDADDWTADGEPMTVLCFLGDKGR